MIDGKPMVKISLVTVSFNAADTIADCLSSLCSQTYPFEHIVVDGGSTDATLKILSREGAQNTILISESDSGVYDAMNKGLNAATGDVVGFLNADDRYSSSCVLATVADVFQNREVDSCYGDLVYVDRLRPERIIRHWVAGKYRQQKFYWGWMPPHPTFFAKRAVYEKHGFFDLNLGSAADYEMMLRLLLKKNCSSWYIPNILVEMKSGGLSNASLKSRWQAHLNDRKAWRVNGLRPFPWTIICKPLRKIPQWFSHTAFDRCSIV